MLKKEIDKIGLGIIILGIVFMLSILAFVPTESKFAGILSITGVIIATVGVIKLTKKYQGTKGFLIKFGFFALCITLVFVIDFIDTSNANKLPRFAISIETITDMMIYKTPFYNVYRINPNKASEYYIVDQDGKYTKETVPVYPFNEPKAGIDKIINYKYQYVGDNSNDGNLIAHLPLSEGGYTFEIDSINFGLIVNYKADVSKIDKLYLKQSLLYNSVSIITLIGNIKYVKFNIGDTTYSVEKEKMEETYPNYIDFIKDRNLNIENFKKYVEDKMKDEEFVEETFEKIFN